MNDDDELPINRVISCTHHNSVEKANIATLFYNILVPMYIDIIYIGTFNYRLFESVEKYRL